MMSNIYTLLYNGYGDDCGDGGDDDDDDDNDDDDSQLFDAV